MFEADDRDSRWQGGDRTPSTGGAGSPDLSGLEDMTPGPELAAMLSRLDPGDVSDAYDLVEVAAACERLKAWADAIEIETAAVLAGHPVCHAAEAARHGFGPVRAAGQLLAPRLGLSPTTAANRVTTAVQLTDELSDTVAALSRGELDYPKAAALATGVRGLDPPDGCADAVTGELITPDGIRRGLVARVEARVLPRAGARSLGQHREAIARAVAAIAPKTAEQRHRYACDTRRVEFRSEADGMAWLSVYGPALDLTAVKVMLDAASEAAKAANPDDPRSYDQVRVDTLTELAWGILEDGQLPDHADADSHDCGCGNADDAPDTDSASAGHGGGCGCRDRESGCGRHAAGGMGDRPGRRRAQRRRRRLRRRNGRAAAINVTVPISTLLGLDERPGELEGYGPITADVARRVAAHGVWRRLLTDPATGVLLDYGTTRYVPPPDLVDHVQARDRTCRFPTCSRPARLCQFDHTIPAGSPGWSTSDRNGGPLNAGCHNGKTHASWRLHQPEPGRFRWTAPTGHTYEVDPEIVGPIIQASTDPDPPIDDLEPEWTTEPDPPPF
jgi:Domain of unknown function (DUF222)